MPTRSFLLLQGGATPFFRRLGRALAAAGHRVHRVNFCAGDRLFWGSGDASDFGEAADRVPAFLDETIRDREATDVLLFGDCRPCHRSGIEVARRHGVRVHVFEEGYLRPGWITLERDGVNGYSRLPKEAAHFRDAAARLAPAATPPPPAEGLTQRTVYDLAYHLANFLFPGRYPGYRNHRQDSAPMEYLGWAARFTRWPTYYASHRAALRQVSAPGFEYFLFPLQLSGDTQIQFHSPFKSMGEGIDCVLESFARHAPERTCLVAKLHPLDTGLVSYRKHISRAASRLCIADRVLFVDGGDLSSMIRHARGIVTVNSTTGMAALRAGRPLFAIGEAVYDVPGLTFQGPLERFWAEPEQPDAVLFEDFLKVLIHKTQIRGGYYSREGIESAVAGALERLTA